MATTNHRLRTAVKLDLRLIEADQIDEPTFNPTRVAGIDYDQDGNAIRYKLLQNHPGDERATRSVPRPVDAADMIHLFRADRLVKGAECLRSRQRCRSLRCSGGLRLRYCKQLRPLLTLRDPRNRSSGV